MRDELPWKRTFVRYVRMKHEAEFGDKKLA